MAPPFPAVVFDLDGTLTSPGTSRAAPGVAALVEALDLAGVPLGVATSAPVRAARRVLDEIGVAPYVSSVAGRAVDGTFGGKDAVVGEALLGLGMVDAPPGVALLGDSAADLHAALVHGLVPVGVAWGGSSAGTLRAAGATAVLEHPDELWALGAS